MVEWRMFYLTYKTSLVEQKHNSNIAGNYQCILYMAAEMMINLIHFFLYCAFDSNKCSALRSSLRNIDQELTDDTESSLSQIFLFGHLSFDTNGNTKIVNWTINYVL